MNSLGHSAIVLCLGCSLAHAAPSLTSEQQSWLAKAKRFERAGWIYLHTEGEPHARGFQHGYLLAPEIGRAMRTTRIEWEHQSAMGWPWLVSNAVAMFVSKIDPENMAELEGIAEAVRAGGVE